MAVADSGSSPVETFMFKKTSLERQTMKFLDYVELLRHGFKFLHRYCVEEQDGRDEHARTAFAALSSIEASADERKRCFAKAILEFTQYATTAFDLSSPMKEKSIGVFEELCHKMEHSDSKIEVSSPCTDKMFISVLKYENNYLETIRQSLKEENQSLVKERDMLDRRLKANEDELEKQTKLIKHLTETLREKVEEMKDFKDGQSLESQKLKRKNKEQKKQIETYDIELHELREKAKKLKRDVVDLENRNQSLERTENQLRTELENLKKSIICCKQELQSIKAENCGLMKRVNEMQKEINTTKSSHEESVNLLRDNIKEKEENISVLQNQIADYKNNLNDKLIEIRQLHQVSLEKDGLIEERNKEIKGQMRELDKTKTEHDIKMKELTELKDSAYRNLKTQYDTHLQDCAKEKTDLRSKSAQLSKHLEILGEHQNTKNKEYEGNIARKDAERRQLASEITNLKLQIQHKDKEVSDLNNGIQDVKKHLRQSEEANRTIEKSLRSMRKTLNDREAQVEELQKTLGEFRRKFVTKVVLYCPRRANLMSEFEECLKCLLESKLNEKNKTLVFEEHSDAQDVKMNDSKPTLVLCFFTSRLGTDAEKAIEGLQLTPKTVLVMIHPKNEDALPQQDSTCILTGQKFSKLGAIVDMAYIRDKGIFPCELNNNSIVKLVSFIKREGVEEREYK